MSNPYAVPSTFTVELEPCCGEVLLGEECDHGGLAPASSYPTPTVLIPAGNGLLKRAETPR